MFQFFRQTLACTLPLGFVVVFACPLTLCGEGNGLQNFFAPISSAPRSLPLHMHLRTIRAQGKIVHIEAGESLPKRRFDDMLKDIRPKLGKFSFQDFELVAAQDEQLRLEERRVFRLTNGQELILRPFGKPSEKQISLWLRWQEADGTRLLDTKFHTRNGETFVAGAETADANQAYILAIQLLAQP